MKVVVVIPTYNEAENLSKLVSQLFDLSIDDLNILVVDDNSPDGTGELAESIKASSYPERMEVIHRSGKLGLGTAYISGFKKALADGADAIVQMDADFSHPTEKIIEMVDALPNYDVVIGSRYVPGGKLDERWPLWRKGLSGFGNVYARMILRLKIKDVTGGFKMWHRDALHRMPLGRVRSNGYAFQIEMNYIATKLGFHFSEIPIYFADRRWGNSKMSLNIQIEAAISVWQIKFRYRDLSAIIGK
jgi:dolichol-phosphate mannosyltransferase